MSHNNALEFSLLSSFTHARLGLDLENKKKIPIYGYALEEVYSGFVRSIDRCVSIYKNEVLNFMFFRVYSAEVKLKYISN